MKNCLKRTHVIALQNMQVGTWCFKRVLTNTTLIISNIKGPLEEIVIADNPVTHMGMNVSSVSQVQI